MSWTVKYYTGDEHPTLRGPMIEFFVAEPREDVELIAAELNSLYNEVQAVRQRDVENTFTDLNGHVWRSPTAWAYFAACRALEQKRKRIEELEETVDALRKVARP